MPPRDVTETIEDVIAKIDSIDYPEFRDVIQAIELAKKSKFNYVKPAKPVLKANHTSNDAVAYADELKSYELAIASYNSNVESVRAWNMQLDQLAQKKLLEYLPDANTFVVKKERLTEYFAEDRSLTEIYDTVTDFLERTM